MVWTVCLLLAGVSLGQDAAKAQRSPARRDLSKGPVMEGKTLYHVAQSLQSAYRSAQRRIRSIEACGELFATLGADGVETLGTSTYRLARNDWEKEVCTTAEAFTTVGGSRVTLCPSFGWLSSRDGAVVLIHEALHSAGLGESPSTPDGLTPAQIDQLVITRCRY